MEDSMEAVPRGAMLAAPQTAEHDLGPVIDARRRILRLLRRRMPWLADPEDVLQQAYAKALSTRAPLRDRTKLVPWFHRLLTTTAIDDARRRASDDRVRRDLALDSSLDPAPPTSAVGSCPCLKPALGRLPASYRRVIERVYADDASVFDVARELATTPNNVRVRLHRARGALRRHLGTCDPGPDARCGHCRCEL